MARLVRVAGAALGVTGLAAYAALQAGGEPSFAVSSVMANTLFPLMDPETAHRAAILAAKWGLFPHQTKPDDALLKSTVWGREFSNPIGIAAGFDKNAEAIEPLHQLGFGFVEVGSITPEPQSGNPRPRVFRLVEDKAVINRYGINNDGLQMCTHRIQAWRDRHTSASSGSEAASRCVLGVNIGKNKDQKNAVVDYCRGVHDVAPLADYVVVNVSCPNVKGFRNMQNKSELKSLLEAVRATRDAVFKEMVENDSAGITDKSVNPNSSSPVPLLVKISPDLTEKDVADVVSVAQQVGVDGIIVANTTTARPANLQAKQFIGEQGGLSGLPLMEPSTKMLAQVYKMTQGTLPLIGVGGVSNANDAYRKIRAGASLVQLYTSLIYQGPSMLPKMKEELCELARKDGFSNIQQAVGADHR